MKDNESKKNFKKIYQLLKRDKKLVSNVILEAKTASLSLPSALHSGYRLALRSCLSLWREW